MTRGENIKEFVHLQNQNYLLNRKPKRVVQNEKNGHKNPNKVENHAIEILPYFSEANE